jgi:hypothetical protein
MFMFGKKEINSDNIIIFRNNFSKTFFTTDVRKPLDKNAVSRYKTLKLQFSILITEILANTSEWVAEKLR